MANKIMSLSLDMNGQSIAPHYEIRRNDYDTNVFKVQVTQGGAPFDFTGMNPIFECQTPDGHYVRDDGSQYGTFSNINSAQGTFEYTLINEIFAVLGQIDYAYFVFEQANPDLENPTNRVSTGNFVFEIIADAVEGNLQASDYNSQLSAMQQQLGTLQTNINTVEQEYTTLNPANYATAAQMTEYTQQTGNYKTASKIQNNQASYIIAVGDSVTYGALPHPSGGQIANPYPSLLQTKLRQVFNNSTITVENQGISGISSGGWLSGTQYNDLVLSKHPDMIILMLGINDIQSGVSLATFESNIDQLISRALASNVEVVLMTEPMILVKNDWVTVGNYQDVNSLNYEYSRICYKLAEKYHISLIDLQQEFIDLFYKTNAYLASDLINTTDFVHPTQQGYEMISEIVVKNFQYSPVMVVDSEKSIGAVGCPFIESNIKIPQTTSGIGLRFFNTYIINTGAYVKFRFIVLKNNLSLSILKGISYYGSNIDVLLDGTLLKTLASNDANLTTDGGTTAYNVKEFLTDLTIGYHEIVFQNPTQVGTSSTFYFLLSALIFDLNNNSRTIAKNKMFILPNNTFVPVNTGLSDDLVCLKSGKKLVINLRGYFQNSVGLTILGATYAAGSVLNCPDNFVSFLNGKIRLTTYNINQTNPVVTVGTNVQDFSKELDVRIEIDDSYNFNIYVNNILELSAVNSQNSIKGGIITLLNQSGSTVNIMINNLSWCYY